MIDTKEILELIERIYSVEINSQLECLSLARHISEIREEEKSKLPFHINVVSSAARGKLKETAHSLILRDLLQSQQIRDSFIETFTPIIAGKEDKYVVLAEKDRIDVSLEGNKHYIIVENKVNGAQEQESQILRYIKIAKEKVKTENIHVVYLNKDNNEWPSDYSLKDDVESVFDTIKEDNFKVFSYKYDILPWLKKTGKRNEWQ